MLVWTATMFLINHSTYQAILKRFLQLWIAQPSSERANVFCRSIHRCRELMSCDPEAVILSSGMSAESTISSYMKIFPNSCVMMQSRMRQWLLVMYLMLDSESKLFQHTHRGSMSRPTLSFLHPSGTGISIESNVIPELASGSIVVRGFFCSTSVTPGRAPMVHLQGP